MQRKPHKHENNRTGQVFDCTNTECKMPYKCNMNVRPTRSTCRTATEKQATRAEQYARYIDCGPQNWDDR
jgi:hypothetical protein